MEAFIDVARRTNHAENGKMAEQLRDAAMSLADATGYSLRCDIDAWESWYLWVTKRDHSVIDRCLASPEGPTVRLGADIAFLTGKLEMIRKVLKRYREVVSHEKGPQWAIDHAVADWVTGKGVPKRPALRDPVSGCWGPVLTPDAAFWERFVEIMAPFEDLVDHASPSVQGAMLTLGGIFWRKVTLGYSSPTSRWPILRIPKYAVCDIRDHPGASGGRVGVKVLVEDSWHSVWVDQIPSPDCPGIDFLPIVTFSYLTSGTETDPDHRWNVTEKRLMTEGKKEVEKLSDEYLAGYFGPELVK